METRMLIFCGGNIGQWAIDEIREHDVLVGADRGALFLLQNGRIPYLACGDFDSVNEQERELIRQGSVNFLACDPVNKDDTDTELALKWAISQNPTVILLLGAVGSRMDHTLANIHLLYQALKSNTACKIVDEHNEIMLIDRTAEIHKSRFEHISLLPLSMVVRGVTLKGFQYPLEGYTLQLGHSLAISNKLIEEIGSISIEEGYLLVIQSNG